MKQIDVYCERINALNMTHLLPYAIKHGRFIHIGEVNSGLRCGCECPACGQPLVAKKGKRNVHHFAHHTDHNCAYGLESTLHYLAKSILQSGSHLMLPPVCLPRQDQALYQASAFYYDQVKLEKGMGGVIPDLIVEKGKYQLLIEIKVSHPVDKAKLWRIRRKGILAVEINASAIFKSLFAQAGQFNEERFKQLLIAGISYKNWLHHPRLQSTTYRLKLQSEKKKVLHRHFNGYHLYAVNHCPLKKRYWKSGYQAGKTYAKVWQDCQHCPHCLQIEFEKAYVAYQEVPQQARWVYCWGHLVDK